MALKLQNTIFSSVYGLVTKRVHMGHKSGFNKLLMTKIIQIMSFGHKNKLEISNNEIYMAQLCRNSIKSLK